MPHDSPRPIRGRRGLAAMVLAGAAGMHLAVAAMPAALPGDLPAGLSLGPDQVYQLALESRTERDYRRMLVLLRHAAGSGHVPAQEMLGSVLVGGPALYGRAVPADRCEAARWARLAMLEGSEVGRHQLLVLNGLRDGAASGARCGPASAGAAGRR